MKYIAYNGSIGDFEFHNSIEEARTSIIKEVEYREHFHTGSTVYEEDFNIYKLVEKLEIKSEEDMKFIKIKENK